MSSQFALHRSNHRSTSSGAARAVCRALIAGLCAVIGACGGGGGSPPPPPPPGVAPTITTQPVSASVTGGTAASFSVAATGDAPLAYQWQRNGADIAGATAATYTLAAPVLGDSGAAFRAVVTNAVGTATSNAATLTVVAAPPVLTITLQPASTSVVAGVSASFTVAAGCSAGTLGVQWQRNSGAGGAWVDITGAATTTYALSTTLADSGAQFRAALDCSGASNTTSASAQLTVTAATAAAMSALTVVGLRDQADITNAAGIVQDASGSFTFLTTNRVKRLSADLLTITPVAGGGAPAAAIDGAADVARFNAPQGIAQDSAGTLYVTDTGNHTIRKITAAGVVSTLAGTAGASGLVDATGASARFSSPMGIALGPDGDLYVGDSDNHRIRRVTPAGVVTTYAGSTGGYTDGAPLSARFTLPRGVAIAPSGDVYVADYGNLRIRVISRSGGVAGAVSTLAGSGMAPVGSPDGIGIAASIPFPSTLALRGNSLAVFDESFTLRQIDITTGVVTTLAGTRLPIGTSGYADGGPGKGLMRIVRGIASVAAGGFMLADTDSLRTVSPAGVVRTIASASQQTNATAAGIGTLPQVQIYMGPDTRQALTVDAAGNVVIADTATRLVRRIAPSGAVTLLAGLPGGVSGLPIDGVANEAQFVSLGPIGTSADGTTYVTDNYGVRKIAADGTTSLFAGSYAATGATDGNAATARFFSLQGLTVGPAGDVFVSDSHAVRRIDSAGNVTTYAGSTLQAGDLDGPAASARFTAPTTLAFGPDGALYIAVSGTIRKVSPDGSTVSRLAVNDLSGGLAVDAAGTVYYGAASGLRSVTAAGVNSLVVPAGSTTTTGANPTLLAVFGLAMLKPKQLVVQANNSLLMVVTLP